MNQLEMLGVLYQTPEASPMLPPASPTYETAMFESNKKKHHLACADVLKTKRVTLHEEEVGSPYKPVISSIPKMVSGKSSFSSKERMQHGEYVSSMEAKNEMLKFADCTENPTVVASIDEKNNIDNAGRCLSPSKIREVSMFPSTTSKIREENGGLKMESGKPEVESGIDILTPAREDKNIFTSQPSPKGSSNESKVNYNEPTSRCADTDDRLVPHLFACSFVC